MSSLVTEDGVELKATVEMLIALQGIVEELQREESTNIVQSEEQALLWYLERET